MYDRAARVVTSSCTVVRGSWSLRTMSGAESVPSPSRKSSRISRARVTAGTRRPTTGPSLASKASAFEISTDDRHDEHRLATGCFLRQWSCGSGSRHPACFRRKGRGASCPFPCVRVRHVTLRGGRTGGRDGRLSRQLSPQPPGPQHQLQFEAAVRVVDLVAPQLADLAEAVADGLRVDAQTGRYFRGSAPCLQPGEQGFREAAAVGGAAVPQGCQTAQGQIVDQLL